MRDLPRLRRAALALLLCAGTAAGQVPEPPPAGTSPQAPPGEGGGLSLLDTVRSTLSLLPDIQMAQQDVIASSGALQAALGQFDYTLHAALSQIGATTPLSADTVLYDQYLLDEYKTSGVLSSSVTAQDRSTTYTTNWSLGLSRQFRWGMTITPSVSLSFQNPQSLNYTYPNLSTYPPNTGTATIHFRLVQPLLRGRGADATAAAETAARMDLEASRHQLRSTIAARIRDVTLDYWSYVSAYQTIAILRQAEERATLVLRQEEQLVRGGEHPAAELKKLQANRAEASTARINAERALVTVKQALGLAMGLRWQDIPALPLPTDTLATIAEQALPSPGEVEVLAERACRQRPDRLALAASIRAAGALVTGTRRSLDPQLDLELDLGYTGLSESVGASPLVTALGDRVRGVNFTGALTFSYPVRNHAARGALQQREAALRRSAIQLGDVDRRIGAQVALAVAELRSEAEALKTAEEAAEAYRVAVVNEEKRLRAGLSTTFDLLITQERLTGAELAALQVRGSVASALVRLRYETGTLLEPSSAEHRLTLEQLTTMPSIR